MSKQSSVTPSFDNYLDNDYKFILILYELEEHVKANFWNLLTMNTLYFKCYNLMVEGFMMFKDVLRAFMVFDIYFIIVLLRYFYIPLCYSSPKSSNRITPYCPA